MYLCTPLVHSQQSPWGPSTCRPKPVRPEVCLTPQIWGVARHRDMVQPHTPQKLLHPPSPPLTSTELDSERLYLQNSDSIFLHHRWAAPYLYDVPIVFPLRWEIAPHQAWTTSHPINLTPSSPTIATPTSECQRHSRLPPKRSPPFPLFDGIVYPFPRRRRTTTPPPFVPF